MNYPKLVLPLLLGSAFTLSAYEIGESRGWSEISDGKSRTAFSQNGPELTIDLELPPESGWTVLKKNLPVIAPDDRISFEILADADCMLETNVVYGDGSIHNRRQPLTGKFGNWEKITLGLSELPFGWKVPRTPTDGAELQIGFSGSGGGRVRLRNFTLEHTAGWNEPGDWQTATAEGNQLTLSRSAEGLAAAVELNSPASWALLTRKITFDSTRPAVITVRSGFSGDLEVKFIEKNGQVHCRKIPVTASERWHTFVVYPEDCEMKWQTAASDSAELQVGFSGQGKGEAVFQDLRLGPAGLPATFASRQTSVFGLPPLRKIDGKATASSSADSVRGVHKPEHAIDGKLDTRWNTIPADGQTLLIEFAEPHDLAGMTIFWEEAFTRHYRVYTSQDGKSYTLAFEEPESDGATDELFFQRSQVKFVKLECVKRATGWGNSLWEIQFKEPQDGPTVTPAAAGTILDAKLQTAFSGENQPLVIDLKRERALGGVELFWGKHAPDSYRLSFSGDGLHFKNAVTVSRTNGGRDQNYFAPQTLRYLKLEPQGRYDLAELRVKNSDEAWTPIRYFKAQAAELPDGAFPLWLYDKQLYWTVTGADQALEETLIGEDGTVEPRNRSFSFAPYLWNGRKLFNARDAKLTQSLEDGYLPVPGVEWQLDGVTLTLTALTDGDAQNDATYLRYTLKNNSEGELAGKLFWLIRPLQLVPQWQHGGVSPIGALSFHDNVLDVNGKPALLFRDGDYRFGGRDAASGEDLYHELLRGELPASPAQLQADSEMLSGAVAIDYRLAPGASRDFYVTVPLNAPAAELAQGDAAERFKQAHERTRRFWLERLNRIGITIPQTELVNVMRSNLAYLLINTDEHSLHPGSRTYDRSWIRDGAIMSQALLDNGLFAEVRDYLRWVAGCQYENGRIPCMLMLDGKMPGWADGWTEWDGNGAYVFAIASYYRFTGDREFIAELFPSVVKTLKFVESLRKQRLTDEYKGTVFYGVIPESNSHEGYFPAKHSLWDDFWILKGWKDGQMLASLVGRENLLPWMKQEETELRKNLLANIEQLTKERNINYIPGCFEMADFDATSTAIAVWPAFEAQYLPQQRLRDTLDLYYRDTLLPRTRKFDSGYTPYELRTANAYLTLGEKQKTLTMLNYFLGDMRPRAWNHWAEVVYPDYELPSYLGDMPHTWIGAIAINVIRNLFVYESNNIDLVFGAGIDPKWLENEFEVKATELPTYFGTVSLRAVRHGNQVTEHAEGTITGAEKLYCANPLYETPTRITVNGREATLKDNRVELPALPAEVIWSY